MGSCGCRSKRKKNNKNKEKKAYGLIDYIVNKLPEIHIPGYSFCGPNTNVRERLQRGETGINKLDEACREHDIAYDTTTNSKDRNKADKELVGRAFKRIYSKDAKIGERASAALVSTLIGTKIGLHKIGLGLTDSRNNNNNNNNSNMRRRKTTRKNRRRRRTQNQSRFVRFGGGIRKTKKKKTKRAKKRVLRIPSRFIGTGLYLKPYRR